MDIQPTLESSLSWDGLKDSVELEGLDQLLRDKTLQAIDILSEKLGMEWPESSLGGPMDEPFFNQAAWTRAYLVEVADAIGAVSQLSGWEKVRANLSTPTNVAGALFEIDLAARALSAGLRVVLQPRSRGQKSVDLAITSSSAYSMPVYVEATTLRRRTRKERQYEQIMDQVMPHTLFQMYGLRGGGRFFRLLVEDEVAEIVEQIHTFCCERKETQTFGRLEIPGSLELWATPHDNETHHSSSSMNRTEVSGPPLEYDPVSRLRVRLEGKIQQMPTLVPCLLVIDLPSHLWFADASALAHAIESMITAYPQVNAVALVRTMSGSPIAVGPPRALGNGHVSITHNRYLFHVEETILVRNRTRAFPQGDSAIERLFVH
jgi:hypothetical protein